MVFFGPMRGLTQIRFGASAIVLPLRLGDGGANLRDPTARAARAARIGPLRIVLNAAEIANANHRPLQRRQHLVEVRALVEKVDQFEDIAILDIGAVPGSQLANMFAIYS